MAEFTGTLFLNPTRAALSALRADPKLRPHCLHITSLPDWPVLAGVRLPERGLLVIDNVYDVMRPDDDDDDDEDEADLDESPGAEEDDCEEPDEEAVTGLEPSRDFLADDAALAPDLGANPFDPGLGVPLPSRMFRSWIQERSEKWGTPIHFLEQSFWADELFFESCWIYEDRSWWGFVGVEDMEGDWVAWEWHNGECRPSTLRWHYEKPFRAFGCSGPVPFGENNFPRERYRL